MQNLGFMGAWGLLAFLIPVLQVLLYMSLIVAAYKGIQALNIYINKNS